MKPALLAALSLLAMTHALADDAKRAAKPVEHAHTSRADESSRGQIESDCNHRATSRELTGHDRQDYVEWCTSRGHRYDRDYVDGYWNADRICYGKADDRSLTGDRRAKYLADCLQRDDDRHYPSR
jgi:hypothetical protein